MRCGRPCEPGWYGAADIHYTPALQSSVPIWYGEMMNPLELQWIKDSIKGDQSAFAELVRHYTAQIYNFCYRLTGNVQTAEDATQETFIKVWKNLKKFDAKQSFRAWIFTIARNTTTDFLRKKKSIPFSNIGNNTEEFAFEDILESDDEHIEETIGKVQDAHYVEKLLDEVPPDTKTVLTLYYQSDMTFDEIARVLGKSINTVKSQHRRALIKLREILSDAPNNPYQSYE
ncbi:MAG: polymerase subunit sigma-24 [Patescibacteria group bacterium]|nr:polymerase subunit sigma-24 [Patescibacteria group bacterium]